MDRSKTASGSVVSGRYALRKQIGRGGTAVVWLATDTVAGRDVAVKILLRELAETGFAQRFLREIRVLRDLRHHNILPLLDSGEHDGQPFLVSDYKRGGTLRTRIIREKQLSISDVVSIGLTIADALGAAHAKGFVHRDVKPENILFDEVNTVFLADFGIVRVMEQTFPGEFITTSGIVLGTPLYMSPEQPLTSSLSGLSDQYSLAAVLYEAIAGVALFESATPQITMSRKQSQPAPPVSEHRPAVPAALEKVLSRALQRIPADRYRNISEFADALREVDLESAPPLAPSPRRRRRIAAVATGTVLLTTAAYWGADVYADVIDAQSVARADTSRIAIFPVARDSASGWATEAGRLFRESVVRWDSLTALDESLLDEHSVRDVAPPAEVDRARRSALAHRAGRYITLSASTTDGQRRFRVRLYDVAMRDRPLDERTAIIGEGASLEQTIAAVAESVLVRPAGSAAYGERPLGTTSLPALQAFLKGVRAVDEWNLAAADSHFASARDYDAGYARAHLWLGMIRRWRSQPAPRWTTEIELAAVARAVLPRSDAAKLDAIREQIANTPATPRPCELWEELARDSREDFVASFGAADCLRRDGLVISDPATVSRWRFRSSYEAAMQHYLRALMLRPVIVGGFRRNGFAAVTEWLFLSGRFTRGGTSAGGQEFAGFPSLQKDTLVFIPLPQSGIGVDSATASRITRVDEVVAHQRRVFRDLGLAWTARDPRSAAAAHALALAHLYLGDGTAAREQIERALQLAIIPAERERIATARLWIRVQLAIPDNLPELRSIRRGTDSLLRSAGDRPVEPEMLAGLAALTGRATAAMRVDRLARSATPRNRLIQELQLAAVLGGPPDSLKALEERVDSAANAQKDSAARDAVRGSLLRAAQASLPHYKMAHFAGLRNVGGLLLDAEFAWLDGDAQLMHRLLEQQRTVREATRAYEIPFDGLYPEGWLLEQSGDAAAAVAWLQPGLSGVSTMTTLADPMQASLMVRTFALRARLARTLGDSETTTRWAAAVVELWSDADPFLKPFVSEMRSLLRR